MDFTSVMWECGPCKIGPNFRLFILVNVALLYLVLGAFVFAVLEEEDQNAEVRILRKIRMDFALKIKSVVTDAELETFISDIVVASQRGIFVTNNVTFISSWSFGQSFFFVGTLLTTIGYGHTTPLSYRGKIFAIFYCLIGVPLVLTMLSAITSRFMRPVEKLLRVLKNVSCFLTTKEIYAQLLHFMIILLILLVFFIFIPAVIFTYIEDDWNYLDSIYYCFISLATIGLGDYIPGEDENQQLAVRAVYKIATTFYLFLGLISVMVMVKTICNINEFHFINYFESDRDEPPSDDSELALLTPKDSSQPRRYTETDNTTSVNSTSGSAEIRHAESSTNTRGATNSAVTENEANGDATKDDSNIASTKTNASSAATKVNTDNSGADGSPVPP